MARRLVIRTRPGKLARGEYRYTPDDTPYPYKDCHKELKQLSVVAEAYSIVDHEERASAQVDLLRMALETIAAKWVGSDGTIGDEDKIDQRFFDQKLARKALRFARRLDDDRTKQRLAGTKSGRVGKR